MSHVEELLKDIEVNLAQRSASRKDEARVMQTMLNDKEYRVGVYSNEGKIDEYSPRDDAQKLVKNILVNGAHLPGPEANAIAENYEFSKTESEAIIGLSKEFVTTYVRCGRKLPLGGREDMNVSLAIKKIPAQSKKLPMNDLNKVESTVTIPEHATIKAKGGCPRWLRGN